MDVTLYWLTQDLRLDDSPALISAASADVLLCVHCVDSRWFHPHRYHVASMGPHRWHFLQQGLDDLEVALSERNQRLMREYGVPQKVLASLISQHQVTRLVCNRQAGADELSVLNYLQQQFPALQIQQFDNNSLFPRDQLPPSLKFTKGSHAAFSQWAAQQPVLAPIQAPGSLPPPVLQLVSPRPPLFEPFGPPSSPPLFRGGEQSARQHVEKWLSTPPRDSTESEGTVGNTLQEQPDNTFSPWLSQGSLSSRRLWVATSSHNPIAAEPAEALRSSLLQREYRHWLALSMGKQLFDPRGLTSKAPLACGLHPERYQKWRHGTTPWPLINACMRQLRETGYLSSTARRIVAACFVRELSIDWRYGAAWFEHMLIDYDVANNWTHWQDMAGVGANNVTQQPFDIDKLTDQYDATGEYRRRWAPDSGELREQPLDSVDAADWPIGR